MRIGHPTNLRPFRSKVVQHKWCNPNVKCVLNKLVRPIAWTRLRILGRRSILLLCWDLSVSCRVLSTRPRVITRFRCERTRYTSNSSPFMYSKMLSNLSFKRVSSFFMSNVKLNPNIASTPCPNTLSNIRNTRSRGKLERRFAGRLDVAVQAME